MFRNNSSSNRRSPQLGDPVVELRHHSRCRQGDALRCGVNGCRLSSVLRKIALSKKVAKQAVVIVMMSRFDVSDTFLTVVMDINCLVMHMYRRQYHHWQIAGQQQERCNMSQETVHLSGCKDTTFPQFTNLFLCISRGEKVQNNCNLPFTNYSQKSVLHFFWIISQ